MFWVENEKYKGRMYFTLKKISLVPIFVHMIKFSDNRYSHPNFELFINIKQQQFF